MAQSRLTRLARLAREVDGATLSPEAEGRIAALVSLLDTARSVLSREMEKVPDARIFTRSGLRVFMATLITEIVIAEGRRTLKKGRS